jgi:hypothetical protein
MVAGIGQTDRGREGAMSVRVAVTEDGRRDADDLHRAAGEVEHGRRERRSEQRSRAGLRCLGLAAALLWAIGVIVVYLAIQGTALIQAREQHRLRVLRVPFPPVR